MESNVRFRNHISIVIEKLGVLGGVVVAYLIANANTMVDLVSMGMPSENLVSLFLVGVAILMVLMVVVGYNVAVWSRTWISLVDGSIVIERNTLHQKKNTIGIKNISNVNLEQNLFEMLIGTCKVKLDTNSLSTADSTDVKIVLKKADAEAFREQITALMHERTSASTPITNEAVIQWDYVATTQDIVRHGLLSIRLFAVVLAVGSIAWMVVLVRLTVQEGNLMTNLSNLLLNLIIFGGLALSAIRSLVMGFIKYYDFKIARRGDKLVIHYGLLKKVQYTIPVRTINGLKLYQSPLARMTGHAMAEIINIGMGDDDAEAEAFLCPYGKTAVTLAHIRRFLPELATVVDTGYDRQPKAVWFVWLWSLVGVALAAISGAVVGEWLLAYWQRNGLLLEQQTVLLDDRLRTMVVTVLWLGVAVVVLLALLRRVLGYFTIGSRLGENYMLLVEGCAQRTYCWMAYRKVQLIRFQQNPAATLMHLHKGRCNILAATRNRVQRLPYMSQANGEVIKEKILNR